MRDMRSSGIYRITMRKIPSTLILCRFSYLVWFQFLTFGVSYAMCHYANLLELFDGLFDFGSNKQTGDTNVLSSKRERKKSVCVSVLLWRVRPPIYQCLEITQIVVEVKSVIKRLRCTNRRLRTTIQDMSVCFHGHGGVFAYKSNFLPTCWMKLQLAPCDAIEWVLLNAEWFNWSMLASWRFVK